MLSDESKSLSAKRKLLLVSVFTLLMSLGWAGCRGFFVKPTLSSLSVTPASLNLQVNGTQQMTATGTFDDNSRKDLTTTVTWTSSNPALVSVTSTGLVKALANTSTAVTITATDMGISGTASVTVGGSTQPVTVACSCGTGFSISTNNGAPVTFTATQNGTDVTTQATWSSSNTTVLSVPATTTTSPIQATIGSTTTSVSVQISAVVSGTTGSVTITVSP